MKKTIPSKYVKASAENRTEGYFFVFDGEWYDRFVRTQGVAKGDICYTY